MFKTIAAALLLAASTVAFAQAPAPKDPAGREHRKEHREKMKAAHGKARQACEGQQGQAHRDCMRKEMCAQSKDAAKCEAHFKDRSEAFNRAYDACKGKATGDEFRSCMREQRVRAKK
jgi:hypothetical protein